MAGISTWLPVTVGAVAYVVARRWAGSNRDRRDLVDDMLTLVTFVILVVSAFSGEWGAVAAMAGVLVMQIADDMRSLLRFFRDARVER